MSAFNEPTRPEDVPTSTGLKRLVSAIMEGWVATHSQEEALALLRAVARVLSDREQRGSVVVRLNKKDREAAEAEAEADREAIALFRKMLEGCIARLMPMPDMDKDDT